MVPRTSCPFRVDVRREGGQESAKCLLLARSFESSEERLVRVQHQVCDACCADARHTPARINHVLASVIYTRAHRELVEGGMTSTPRSWGVLRKRSGSDCITGRPRSTEVEMLWV